MIFVFPWAFFHSRVNVKKTTKNLDKSQEQPAVDRFVDRAYAVSRG